MVPEEPPVGYCDRGRGSVFLNAIDALPGRWLLRSPGIDCRVVIYKQEAPMGACGLAESPIFYKQGLLKLLVIVSTTHNSIEFRY